MEHETLSSVSSVTATQEALHWSLGEAVTLRGRAARNPARNR
jgi:hypothetical protein